MTKFENEIIEYLNLPSIPAKEWDRKTGFDKGVAVVKLLCGGEAYAACTYNPEKDNAPRVTKVFTLEQFNGIEKVLVVPSYMNSIEDVADMDLDEESKRKAEGLLKEAGELENEGSESTVTPMEELPEWIFPEIKGKEQAVAWLKRYNSSNKIKGNVSKNPEVIKLRLYAIYSEINKTK